MVHCVYNLHNIKFLITACVLFFNKPRRLLIEILLA